MVSGVGVSRLATRQLLLRAQNERETFPITIDNNNNNNNENENDNDNDNDNLVEGMGDLNGEGEEEKKKDMSEESTLTTRRRRKALLSLSTSSLLSVTTTDADREEFQETKMNDNDNKSILSSSKSHAITLSKVECENKESKDVIELQSSASKHSSSVIDITSHSVVPNTELLGVQSSSVNNSNNSLTINPPLHSSNSSSTSIDQIIQLNFQRKKSLTSHQSPSYDNKWQQKSTFFPVFVFNGDETSSPTPSLLESVDVNEKEVLFNYKEDNTFLIDMRKQQQNTGMITSTIKIDTTPWKGGMTKLNQEIKSSPSYKVSSEEGIFSSNTLLGKCLSGSLSSEYVRPRLLSPNKVFLNNSYSRERKSVN